MQERKFGYIPDVKDDRDVMFKARFRDLILPETTMERNISTFTHRYDQGATGACTAFALAAAFRATLAKHNLPDFDPSFLFQYYNARTDKANDTGATIRDSMKAAARFGICSNAEWPYIEAKFHIKPSEAAYVSALAHQLIRYERLSLRMDEIKEALSLGYQVVYGKRLFESFMSRSTAKSGVIPMPGYRDSFVGGHAMTMFDYDPTHVTELNSWGPSWGKNGTCKVPWDYILDPGYCSDLWVIYLTE